MLRLCRLSAACIWVCTTRGPGTGSPLDLLYTLSVLKLGYVMVTLKKYLNKYMKSKSF